MPAKDCLVWLSASDLQQQQASQQSSSSSTALTVWQGHKDAAGKSPHTHKVQLLCPFSSDPISANGLGLFFEVDEGESFDLGAACVGGSGEFSFTVYSDDTCIISGSHTGSGGVSNAAIEFRGRDIVGNEYLTTVTTSAGGRSVMWVVEDIFVEETGITLLIRVKPDTIAKSAKHQQQQSMRIVSDPLKRLSVDFPAGSKLGLVFPPATTTPSPEDEKDFPSRLQRQQQMIGMTSVLVCQHGSKRDSGSGSEDSGAADLSALLRSLRAFMLVDWATAHVREDGSPLPAGFMLPAPLETTTSIVDGRSTVGTNTDASKAAATAGVGQPLGQPMGQQTVPRSSTRNDTRMVVVMGRARLHDFTKRSGIVSTTAASAAAAAAAAAAGCC